LIVLAQFLWAGERLVRLLLPFDRDLATIVGTRGCPGAVGREALPRDLAELALEVGQRHAEHAREEAGRHAGQLGWRAKQPVDRAFSELVLEERLGTRSRIVPLLAAEEGQLVERQQQRSSTAARWKARRFSS
jgi:hypothetical protein